MFEQRGNLFVAYDLSNDGKKQSFGKMEKIETDNITINHIKQLLSEGKILNAASIVAFYKALDFISDTCYRYLSFQTTLIFPYFEARVTCFLGCRPCSSELIKAK